MMFFKISLRRSQTEIDVKTFTTAVATAFTAGIILQYFNPLKHSGVTWLHFEVFSAIQV